MSEQKENLVKILWSFLSIVLSILLFFSAIFIIYANEMIIDKSSKMTNAQEKEYYNSVFLGEYLKKASDYKVSISVWANNHSWDFSKWWIRLFWILWFWLALSLFLFPTFSSEPKDKLSAKAFVASVVFVPTFIILIKIYLFYKAWWFAVDFSWFTDRSWWWLSASDKFFILLFILLIFVALWLLYNHQQKEQEQKK